MGSGNCFPSVPIMKLELLPAAGDAAGESWQQYDRADCGERGQISRAAGRADIAITAPLGSFTLV